MAFDGIAPSGVTEPKAAEPTPASTPSPTPAAGSAPAGTPATPSWTMPESLKGLPQEALAKKYTEMETVLGRQSHELGELRRLAGQVAEFSQAWEPVLRVAGYRPERVMEALQRLDSGTATPTDKRIVTQATQAAKGWGEAVSPDEQERWIQDRIDTVTNTMAQQYQQMLYDGINSVAGWFNRYGDYALRAVEAKMTNPALRDVPLNTILQEAVQYVSQPPDPIQFASAMRQLPQVLQQVHADAARQAREAAETEFKNKAMTTFVGAGGSPRPFPRPASLGDSSLPSQSQPIKRTESSWDQAVERAARRIQSLPTP